MTDKEKHLLDRMRALCSRRECCTWDIRRKVAEILRKDISEEDPSGLMGVKPGADTSVEEIVASLVADRYIDDLRYASAFARDKAAIAGWGRVKIRHALEMKKIPANTISDALQEIDEGRADERLLRLLENKYRSLKDDPLCRMKLVRYALGRGYEYDMVRSVIEQRF